MEKVEKKLAKLALNQVSTVKIWNDLQADGMPIDAQIEFVSHFSAKVKQMEPTERLTTEEKEIGMQLLNSATDIKLEVLKKSKGQFMRSIISIYRHLLLKEKCDLVEIGEKLLHMTALWCHETGNRSQDVVVLTVNAHAYSWNFFRENQKSIEPVKLIRFLSQAMRWLMRQGLSHLSGVTLRLHSVSFALEQCGDFGVVQNVVEELFQEVQEVAKADPVAKSNISPTLFDGSFNFCAWVVTLIVTFRFPDNGQKLLDSVICGFENIIQKDLAIAVGLLSQMLLQHLGFIAQLRNEDHETSEAIVVNRLPIDDNLKSIPQTLTDVACSVKVEGAASIVYYGYVYCISTYLQKLLKTARKTALFGNGAELLSFSSHVRVLATSLKETPASPDVPHISEKRRELLFQIYILILRLIIDHVHVTKESSADILSEINICFEQLLQLLSEGSISQEQLDEIILKIGQTGSQVGSALVKVGDFLGATSILQTSISIIDRFSTSRKVQISSSQLGMILADALNRTDRHECSLKVLALMLVKYPHLIESADAVTSTDLFASVSWYDWSYQWTLAKRSAFLKERYFLLDKTVTACAMESSETLNSNLIQRMLKFELASYFATKTVIPEGLIGVGEEMVRKGITFTEKILGFLAQAIGFWWGDYEHILEAITCCTDALALMKQAEIHTENRLLTALLHGWLGLALHRKFQELAVKELDVIKNEELTKNPKKQNESDEDLGIGRVVPAITSLTMENEHEVIGHLVLCMDTIHELYMTEKLDAVENVTKTVGSGLLITSVRAVSEVLNYSGYQYHYLKSCVVLKALAVAYGRTALDLHVTCELLRHCDSLERTFNDHVAEIKAKVASNPSNSTAKKFDQYFLKASIANAILCMRSNRHQKAVSHLAEIFEYRTSPDTSDIGLQVIGESYYIMADLKLLDPELKLDLSALPKYIRCLSPAGLVYKGFKTLGMVSRHSSPITSGLNEFDSGWHDLFHNYNLLGVVMNTADAAIKLFYLCGKLRESRCIAADLVFIAQQTALISRTVEILLPITEMDMSVRSFESFQQKVECFISMLKGYIPDDGSDWDEEKIVNENPMRLISKLELTKLLTTSNDCFDNLPIALPTYSFGIFGPPSNEFVESPSAKTTVVKIPRFMYLHHNLGCKCHICIHPKIIPSVLRFYCIQARVAACNEDKQGCVQMLEAVNKYHMKAILRILTNLKTLGGSFQYMFPDEAVSDVMFSLYSNFCVQPGLNSQCTKMEAMSTDQLKYIAPCFQQISEGLRLIGLDYKAHKSVSLEILAAAVFRAVFHSGEHIQRTGPCILTTMEQEITNQKSAFHNETSPERSTEVQLPVIRAPGKKLISKRCTSDSEEDDLPDAEYINGAAKVKAVKGTVLDFETEVGSVGTEVSSSTREPEIAPRITRSRAKN